MTVIWGGPLLRILRHYKIGKIIRVEEPGHHGVKMGTPTMGGVMFILPVLLFSGLLNFVALSGLGESGVGRSVLVPMAVMFGFAILGAIDKRGHGAAFLRCGHAPVRRGRSGVRAPRVLPRVSGYPQHFRGGRSPLRDFVPTVARQGRHTLADGTAQDLR